MPGVITEDNCSLVRYFSQARFVLATTLEYPLTFILFPYLQQAFHNRAHIFLLLLDDMKSQGYRSCDVLMICDLIFAAAAAAAVSSGEVYGIKIERKEG